jgi:hypothetical protein
MALLGPGVIEAAKPNTASAIRMSGVRVVIRRSLCGTAAG